MTKEKALNITTPKLNSMAAILEVPMPIMRETNLSVISHDFSPTASYGNMDVIPGALISEIEYFKGCISIS